MHLSLSVGRAVDILRSSSRCALWDYKWTDLHRQRSVLKCIHDAFINPVRCLKSNILTLGFWLSVLGTRVLNLHCCEDTFASFRASV
ncbi:hypothetical protein PENSPDRAFT_646513 [Peniophora sp. CONT]|nr:hypothetical protein PENSPDRAFT_646513 [Peniophora sp. CONT]